MEKNVDRVTAQSRAPVVGVARHFIETHTLRLLGIGDSVHSTEERFKCVSIKCG
jgi:hypothetical protein